MNINLTIIVQVINFLIAYILIVNILLKPAIKIILKKRKRLADLKTELKNEEQRLLFLESEKNQLWEKYLADLRNNNPKIIDQNNLISLNINSSVKSKHFSFSNADIDVITKELLNSLKLKL